MMNTTEIRTARERLNVYNVAPEEVARHYSLTVKELKEQLKK